MSTLVLPNPPGQGWNRARRPVWDTVVKTSVSGRTYANSRWSYPKWRYALTFDVLRARASMAEMQELAGFFNKVYGRGDTFLYNDPNDNTVSSIQALGVGNGTQTQFQLVRTFGGYVEPVIAPVAPTGFALYVNGVGVAGSVNTSTGIATFNVAPAAGTVPGWTGTFHWRCRFLDDSLDFNEFMRQFWELRRLEFITEKA